MKLKDSKLGYLLFAPTIFVVFVIIGIPFVYAVFLSFTDKIVGCAPHFIGLKNYINIFKDSDYWRILTNTFIYFIAAVAFKYFFGMIYALVLNEKFYGRTVAIICLLIPWTIPSMVAANTWKWMFNDSYGIINSILERIHLIHSAIPWLSDTRIVLFSVIVVNIWRGVPFFIFSLMGGLQTIDKQLYEAAEMDGANWIQKFGYITMPSVSAVSAITILLSSIWTFNDFDNVYLVTGGGPVHSSAIISIYTYEKAFTDNLMGISLSAATSVIPIILLMIFFAMKNFASDSTN